MQRKTNGNPTVQTLDEAPNRPGIDVVKTQQRCVSVEVLHSPEDDRGAIDREEERAGLTAPYCQNRTWHLPDKRN
eukprot:1359919-Rhodomonas_salina.3